MTGDLGEYGSDGPGAQLTMPGHCHMVLASALDGQSHVATALAGDLVAEAFEPRRQLFAGDAPRQPHKAMSSSRT